MLVDTELLIPMTDANQNFSKVTRLVDEQGLAVILKNNKPRYIVVDFNEYEEVKAALQQRSEEINAVADAIIERDREALLELAK